MEKPDLAHWCFSSCTKSSGRCWYKAGEFAVWRNVMSCINVLDKNNIFCYLHWVIQHFWDMPLAKINVSTGLYEVGCRLYLGQIKKGPLLLRMNKLWNVTNERVLVIIFLLKYQLSSKQSRCKPWLILDPWEMVTFMSVVFLLQMPGSLSS